MRQAEVIEKVKSGWILRRSVGFTPHYYIQHPDHPTHVDISYPTGTKIAKMKNMKWDGKTFPIESYKWVPCVGVEDTAKGDKAS